MDIEKFLIKWQNKDKYNNLYFYFLAKKHQEIIKINTNPFNLDQDIYWQYPNYGWGNDYLIRIAETEENNTTDLEAINKLMLLINLGLNIEQYNKSFNISYIYEQIFVFADFEKFNLNPNFMIKKINNFDNNKIDILGLSLWRGMVIGKKNQNNISIKIKNILFDYFHKLPISIINLIY